jgi:tRNA pseudouridine38-40 synthase
MYYYRVTIAYKGTRYFGWQAQAVDTSQEAKPTVEGTILKTLKKIANHQPCTISAASRTDAGVHAQGQIAKLILPIPIKPEHLLMGLNTALPVDIRILDCQLSSKAYQPTKTGISKEYHYYFSDAVVENVAISDIAANLPIRCADPKVLALLRSACQLFVGYHDFYSFGARDKGIVGTSREIFYCNIEPANFSPLADNMYYLKIVGDGFLKYMVRYLMGALIDLAAGRVSLADIDCYLQQHKEQKLSPRADAKGLHLINIEELA